MLTVITAPTSEVARRCIAILHSPHSGSRPPNLRPDLHAQRRAFHGIQTHRWQAALSACRSSRSFTASTGWQPVQQPYRRRGTRIRGRRAHISEPQRLLTRSRRLEITALPREHADLGRRAARRGKTANLTAGCQDPVAGGEFEKGARSKGTPRTRKVRCGLPAGGRWIRTSGPPSAAIPLSDR